MSLRRLVRAGATEGNSPPVKAALGYSMKTSPTLNKKSVGSSDSSTPTASAAMCSLPCGRQEMASAIVNGVVTGRPLIAVVNLPGAECKPVIEASLIALGEQRTRVAQVVEGSSISFFGPPVSAMDLLSLAAEADAEEKKASDAAPDHPVTVINRALKVLGCKPFGEKRRLLVIDPMQVLPPGALEELARLTTTSPPELPTQMLFVGDAAYWHHMQSAKFEDLRRRIGLPFVVYPSTGMFEAKDRSAQTFRQEPTEGQPAHSRRRLAPALVNILIMSLGIAGVLEADTDLSSRLFAHMLELLTAFMDWVRGLAAGF